MPSFYVKGGLPVFVTGQAAAGSVKKYEWREGASNEIIFQNLDAASTILLSFSEDDANAGRGLTIPAVLGTPGNPITLPVEAARFYVQSNPGAANFSALVFVRRG